MASNVFNSLMLEVTGLAANTSRATIKKYFTQCCSGLEVITIGKKGDAAIVEIKQITGDSELFCFRVWLVHLLCVCVHL